MNCAAIILAAGPSSRMGQPKQMLQIGGEKLLRKTINTALESELNRVCVVLGSHETEMRDLIAGLPVELVLNSEWKKGMGGSIKAGLQHLLSHGAAPDCIVILVCDQPLLRKENISNLIQEHRKTKKPIIASGYSETSGAPVLFNKKYFDELRLLPDDQGAKKIILRNPSDVVVIPFPEGEIDLDTPEDYQKLTRHL
ncbi:MAG TPA: nucleotidyltransferase family protein [Chryseosolibacter sp.]